MSSRTPDTSLAPAFAGVAGLLLLGAGVLRHWALPLPFPPCLFRLVTHLPCPMCGGTRCLLALSRGEFLPALAWNPLVTVGFLAIAVWFGGWLMGKWWDRPLRLRNGGPGRNLPLRITLAAFLLIHWIYLCWNLPS